MCSVSFPNLKAPEDVFDNAIECFESKGVENCLEYGTVWRDKPHLKNYICCVLGNRCQNKNKFV